MQLFNFLSRKVEEFKPIKAAGVSLYTCGPTVYDYVHIGNWRTFVFEDILKRALVFNGYKVKHVMNITDIDDKTIAKSKEQGIDLKELTSKYENAFISDLSKLNIIPADIYARATEHITPMIRIIQALLEKGFAYKADDGVYFSVAKFKDYGKLSGLSNRNLKKGARVNDDQYDKESWSDFALWKFPQPRSSPGLEPAWDAPFGKGRPGWHIECSAMSMEELEGTIDIHTGGVDLLFPHHENEIAQSEAATGKKFVNYWLEGEHLLVDGEKMSKSLGNIYTLSDIAKKGFDPLALRYLYLTAHYRSKLNFTWQSLESADRTLVTLQVLIKNWLGTLTVKGKLIKEHEGEFREVINDDLDMPRAIAILWKVVKSREPFEDRLETILFFDQVFGLGLADLKKAQLPKGAKELIEKREELRKAGKFNQSDNLREELNEMGVEIEDTVEGPKWKVRKSIKG